MITVTYEKELELSPDQADDVVVQSLQENFIFLTNEINELKSYTNLHPVQAQDMIRSMDVRDGIKNVLSYYMTKNDYVDFMSEYGA